MSIVSILCVPVGGAVLRLVSVLYSLMVEKVERLLRGQWSAFNIYGASRCASRSGVSSSRLVFSSRLLVSSLVSFIVSSVRLVAASRCCVPCLSFRLVSSLRIVSSCISLGRSMSLASRVVPPSRVSFCSSGRCSSRPVLSCRSHGGWRLVSGRGRRGRRRWCSLVVMRCCGGGVLFPVFRLARRGQVDRVVSFYPARSCPYLRMSESGSWQDGIDMR